MMISTTSSLLRNALALHLIRCARQDKQRSDITTDFHTVNAPPRGGQKILTRLKEFDFSPPIKNLTPISALCLHVAAWFCLFY